MVFLQCVVLGDPRRAEPGAGDPESRPFGFHEDSNTLESSLEFDRTRNQKKRWGSLNLVLISWLSVWIENIKSKAFKTASEW